MAKRLKMKFGCESGDTRTISLDGPKANLNAAAASAALNAMVEAGEAFSDPLTSGLRAEVVETTTTVLVNNES